MTSISQKSRIRGSYNDDGKSDAGDHVPATPSCTSHTLRTWSDIADDDGCDKQRDVVPECSAGCKQLTTRGDLGTAAVFLLFLSTQHLREPNYRPRQCLQHKWWNICPISISQLFPHLRLLHRHPLYHRLIAPLLQVKRLTRLSIDSL